MKKIIISFVALSMSLGLVANAQVQPGVSGGIKISNVQVSPNKMVGGASATAASTVQPVRTQAKEAAKEANQEIKAGVKNEIKSIQEKKLEARKEIKNQLSSGAATSSEAIKSLIQKMQQEREDFKVNVQTLRSNAQAKIAQNKEELKTKLQVVKSEVKKTAVENVDKNLVKINENFVDRWTNASVQLDAFLAKIIKGVNAASASSTGKDFTSVNSAISSANSAISMAKMAIEAQAQKTYQITITSEANLKNDVSSVRTNLNKDLNAVKDLIQASHSAVTKALVEYNKIK